MTAHVDVIIGELAHTKAGAEKALSMFGEADRLFQSSIDAAARGGFAAMAANLVAAQQQLRQLQALLHNTCGEVGQALEPVAKAPKEIDAAPVGLRAGLPMRPGGLCPGVEGCAGGATCATVYLRDGLCQ